MLETLLNLYKISIHITDKILKLKIDITDVIFPIFFLLFINNTCNNDLIILYPSKGYIGSKFKIAKNTFISNTNLISLNMYATIKFDKGPAKNIKKSLI